MHAFIFIENCFMSQADQAALLSQPQEEQKKPRESHDSFWLVDLDLLLSQLSTFLH